MSELFQLLDALDAIRFDADHVSVQDVNEKLSERQKLINAIQATDTSELTVAERERFRGRLAGIVERDKSMMAQLLQSRASQEKEQSNLVVARQAMRGYLKAGG